MRYLGLIFLLCFSVSSSLAQQERFTIKGRINKDSKAEKIYLQGSAMIEIPLQANKEFTYSGVLKEPVFFLINTDKSFAWGLWIAAGDIDVTLQEWEFDKPDPSGKKLLKITSLSGPPETEKRQWFSDQQAIIGRRFPSTTLANFNDSMAKYYDPLIEEYIKAHPDSKFSVHITSFAHSKANKARLLALINKELTKEETLSLQKAVQREKVTSPGLQIEDFQINDVNGKIFSLNKLSAKYTLIDFWASWCGPCRVQHPALIKVYKEFRDKGFEVVAISLDDRKSDWKKAIKHDKLPWINLSQLQGWEGSLAQKYFVSSIPFNFLIDENKKIIATNLYPAALTEKLKELFKN